MTALLESQVRNAGAEEWRFFCRSSRSPRLRTMREFSEQEIIIPDGRYRGRKFRVQRQPFSGLYFDAVDSGEWNRFVATGPTQSGKTLTCFVIPTMYHLFELKESVICGLPDMQIAADKWREDFEPAIVRSRYRDLIPRRGGGSRGGKVEAIKFLNGATLRFMSGGGGDKSRSHYTARVVVITETDGLDESSGTSREADKITQLEARTRSFGDEKRVYMECTVSIEQGRTWREYRAGTRSEIYTACPHCKKWTMLERPHLLGWEACDSVIDARSGTQFFCPECGEAWTDDQRRASNEQARLVHRGQTIDRDGIVHGQPAKTDTLGFRWSAANNMFWTAGYIGADEWKAARSEDEENAEKEMRQFVWCMPYEPPTVESTPLEVSALVRRVRELKRGSIPPDMEYLTMAVDIGKFLCHWVTVAWSAAATSYVVDYDVVETSSSKLGVERGVRIALDQLRDMVLTGWPVEGGDNRVPDQVWIDSLFQRDVVYDFCRSQPKGGRFRPTMGLGASQDQSRRYHRPDKIGQNVRHIGEGYHFVFIPKDRVYRVEVNADHWKTWVHRRLSEPTDNPGAMTLFHAQPNDHLSFAKHLTAERQIEEFVAGKGTIVRYEKIRKNNHWLDALYNASAAGHFCGARMGGNVKPRVKRQSTTNRSDDHKQRRPHVARRN